MYKLSSNIIQKYYTDVSNIFENVGVVSQKVKDSKKLVLCFLNRTGSNYYSELMSNTEMLGDAKEFLNQDKLIHAKNYYAVTNFADYFDYIYKKSATMNNVFSFQLGMHQLHYLLSVNDELKIFDSNTKFLYITRSDIVMQTVSFYKASKTNQYASYHKGKSTKLEYDEEKMLHMFNRIIKTMMDFEYIFSTYNIIPYRVNYEVLEKYPDKIIKETLDFINIEKYNILNIKTRTKLQVQRDELSAIWAFKLRERLQKEL